MVFKSFIKLFVVFFIIFTVTFALLPLELHGLGETPVFSVEEDPEIVKEFEFRSIVQESNPYYDMFSEDQKVNILCVGINGGLTDTILLAIFDIDRGHVDMISIPRDTYYPRKGYNSAAEKKINAAYRKDINNTAKAVSELLFDVPIHYYAIIDFKGVANIVESIGGVPMDIPFRMKYTDKTDKPPLYIDIPKGSQVLDGKTAVKFLRFRQGDKGYPGYSQSDLDRQMMQQQFLKSAFEQSLGLNLPKVIRSIHENVKSNLDIMMALKLAAKTTNMSRDDFSSYILPGISETSAPWYYHQNVEETEALIKQIYQPEEQEEPEDSDDTVAVN